MILFFLPFSRKGDGPSGSRMKRNLKQRRGRKGGVLKKWTQDVSKKGERQRDT